MTQNTFSSDMIGTIQKTIMISHLFEGFWDRWISHGMEADKAKEIRRKGTSLERWIELLYGYASDHKKKAESFLARSLLTEAEYAFRQASLYYNLMQWIYPKTCKEKRDWYQHSIKMFRRADLLSSEKITESVFLVDGIECSGRVRSPEFPQGCIVIVNPIDSTKEELFTYELDFVKQGFATVSFDGPGQGRSYIMNQLHASHARWSLFMQELIGFAKGSFPGLPINLFGTSSGASWTIYGSSHPFVHKAVSVSPACQHDVEMPDYFVERMSYISDKFSQAPLPQAEEYRHGCPILIFHGNRDVMVKDEQMYALYERIPNEKRLIEFKDEGHCCNYRLPEVRKISCDWFAGRFRHEL